MLRTAGQQAVHVGESGTKGNGNAATFLQLFQKSKLVSKYKVNKASRGSRDLSPLQAHSLLPALTQASAYA